MHNEYKIQRIIRSSKSNLFKNKHGVENFTQNKNNFVFSTYLSPNNRDVSAVDIKLALCCIAKWENRYLAEWIEYHHQLGFDHIYIIDNNGINDEHCKDILSESQLEYVTIIDKRGALFKQSQYYTEIYHAYNKLYDWIGFIDVDEFLTFTHHNSAKEYFSDSIFKPFDSIKINWLCYGDNGNVKYENKPVLERFTEPCDEYLHENCQIKSFFRTNIHDFKMTNPHYAFNKMEICDNSGKLTMFIRKHELPYIDHSLAFLRHFITKSTEEFINIKRNRRIGPVGPIGDLRRLSSDFYFRYNIRTQEKEQIIGNI